MSAERQEDRRVITIGSDMSTRVRLHGQPLLKSREPKVTGVYTSDMSEAGQKGIKVLPVTEQ